MGHGDRWGLLGDSSEITYSLLPSAIERGKHFPAKKMRVEDIGNADVSVSHYFPEEHELVGCAFYTVMEDRTPSLYSLFPLLRSQSSPAEFTFESVKNECFGIEGIVSVHCDDGPVVTFFDPYYPLNSDRYEEGQRLAISFSAFVYKVTIPRHRKLVVDDEKTVRNYRAALERCRPEEVTNLAPVVVNMEGMTAYFPGLSGTATKDDFEFRGRLGEMMEMTFMGQKMQVTDMLICNCVPELRCTMYIPANAIAKEMVLKPGMEICGAGWMQGFLSELAD